MRNVNSPDSFRLIPVYIEHFTPGWHGTVVKSQKGYATEKRVPDNFENQGAQWIFGV